MKRLVSLFMLACLISSAFIYAQQQDESYNTVDEAKEALDRAQSQIRSGDDCATGVRKRNDENNAKWQKANDQINKIIAERNKAVAEMREGLYCDQCWNTKSEIEKTGESFSNHLKRVNGKAVPAPPEKINQKIKDYAEKVDSVQKQIDDYRKNYNQNVQDYQGCQNLRSYGFNEAAKARYWVTTLTYRAEQEKRRKAIEEAARQLREKIEADNERRRQAYEAMLEQQRQKAEERRQMIDKMREGFKKFEDNLLSMFQTRSDPDYIVPDSEDSTSINRGYFGDDRTDEFGESVLRDENKSFLTRMQETVERKLDQWNSVNDVFKTYGEFDDIYHSDHPIGDASDWMYDQAKDAAKDKAWEIGGDTFARQFIGGDYDNPEVRREMEEIGLQNLPKTWYQEIRDFSFFTRMKESWNRIKGLPKWWDRKMQDAFDPMDDFLKKDDSD